MLINEIYRIMAQVRFQGYPLFSANIRPFFRRGIEFAEVSDRGSLFSSNRIRAISGRHAVKPQRVLSARRGNGGGPAGARFILK
jgi:hypothetical protein